MGDKGQHVDLLFTDPPFKKIFGPCLIQETEEKFSEFNTFLENNKIFLI